MLCLLVPSSSHRACCIQVAAQPAQERCSDHPSLEATKSTQVTCWISLYSCILGFPEWSLYSCHYYHKCLIMTGTCACVLSHFSQVWSFVAPWTIARQAPLSIGFWKILKWGAISYSWGTSLPRDRIHVSCSSCLAGGFFITEPPGKPDWHTIGLKRCLWNAWMRYTTEQFHSNFNNGWAVYLPLNLGKIVIVNNEEMVSIQLTLKT